MAKSGTNSGNEWDYQWQQVGLTMAMKGTNSGKNSGREGDKLWQQVGLTLAKGGTNSGKGPDQ